MHASNPIVTALISSFMCSRQYAKPKHSVENCSGIYLTFSSPIQANLGLRRGAQCEKALSLAGMLALKESNATSNIMRSQLSRLHGQLYAFQVSSELLSSHPTALTARKVLG